MSVPWQPHHSAPEPAGEAQLRPNPAAPAVASIGERIGARLLDLIILMVPLIALDAAVRAVTSSPATTPAGEEDPLAALSGFATMALILGYEWGMTRWRGATIGKSAVGIHVASANDARPASALILAFRVLIQVLLWSLLLPGFLDLRAGAKDPQGRTWHDRMTGTVVLRGRRSRDRQPTDALPAPWSRLVADATAARVRFDEVLRAASAGPTRDRLKQLRGEVSDCVGRCEETARRGVQLQHFAQTVNIESVRSRLVEAEEDLRRQPDDRHAAELAETVRSELASAERLRGLVDKTQRSLRRLVSQLNDIVNRAAEFAFAQTGQGSDLDAVVHDLEALRQGFAEVESTLESGCSRGFRRLIPMLKEPRIIG